MHQEIVRFWFEELTPQQWWAVDPAFDALLRSVRVQGISYRSTFSVLVADRHASAAITAVVISYALAPQV
jgi:hypothetical protein